MDFFLYAMNFFFSVYIFTPSLKIVPHTEMLKLAYIIKFKKEYKNKFVFVFYFLHNQCGN